MQLRAAAIRWIDRAWPAGFAMGICALLVALYWWEPAASGLFPAAAIMVKIRVITDPQIKCNVMKLLSLTN